MTDTAKTTQLKLWGEERELRTELSAITEFERWWTGLKRPGSIAPTLAPDDHGAVAFAVAFHDVVADFEDREGPVLRRELKRACANDVLAESVVSLRLLQRVIDECKHRNVRLPQGLLALKASIALRVRNLRCITHREDQARAS